jgi:F-type H+-transporting ATPase subunit delta
MRDVTIARNYAEALLDLARKANSLRGWGDMINEFASAMERDATLRLFLESPRISVADKNQLLANALQDRMPRLMVRYIQMVVKNRRQMLIPEIAREYLDLVDVAEGRLHARVTVATESDETLRRAIAIQLSRLFGKDVVPHMTVDPQIIGGVVVHIGDTVLDGSVRRRMSGLRRRLLRGTL